MRVQDVMTADAECISPDDHIMHAAERMRDLNVGSLPVCGDRDRLVGMITDRDITIRATADGRVPEQTFVRDVMTPDLVFCFQDQDVSEAADLMEQHQIRRLPVLNKGKRLVGILSIGDLAVKTHDDRMSGEALERVSEPAAPTR